MAKMIICVVDDDFVFRTTSKRMLQKLRHSDDVLMFEDGEKAFEFIEKHQNEKDVLPDVIFLDLNMPYMDGWDFLDEYMALKPAKKITIYVVSSSILDSDRDRAKTYSEVSDYLIKPVEKEQFVQILENLAANLDQ